VEKINSEKTEITICCYGTPKALQKMRLDNNIFAGTLRNFCSEYTNNPKTINRKSGSITKWEVWCKIQ
jgi:hypothetical protein